MSNAKMSKRKNVEWKNVEFQNVDNSYFDIMSIRHFINFDILSICRFINFDILSIRHLINFDILSIRHFINFEILSFRHSGIRYFANSIFNHLENFAFSTFWHSTFCPWQHKKTLKLASLKLHSTQLTHRIHSWCSSPQFARRSGG